MTTKTDKLLSELESAQGSVAPIEIVSLMDRFASNPTTAKWREDLRAGKIRAAATAVGKIATDGDAMAQLAATYDLLVYGPTHEKALKVIASLQADLTAANRRNEQLVAQNQVNQTWKSRALSAEKALAKARNGKQALIEIIEDGDEGSIREKAMLDLRLASEEAADVKNIEKHVNKKLARAAQVVAAINE